MIIQYTCVCQYSTVVFVLPEFNKYLYHYVNFVINEFVIITIAMVLFNNII